MKDLPLNTKSLAGQLVQYKDKSHDPKTYIILCIITAYMQPDPCPPDLYNPLRKYTILKAIEDNTIAVKFPEELWEELDLISSKDTLGVIDNITIKDLKTDEIESLLMEWVSILIGDIKHDLVFKEITII